MTGFGLDSYRLALRAVAGLLVTVRRAAGRAGRPRGGHRGLGRVRHARRGSARRRPRCRTCCASGSRSDDVWVLVADDDGTVVGVAQGWPAREDGGTGPGRCPGGATCRWSSSRAGPLGRGHRRAVLVDSAVDHARPPRLRPGAALHARGQRPGAAALHGQGLPCTTATCGPTRGATRSVDGPAVVTRRSRVGRAGTPMTYVASGCATPAARPAPRPRWSPGWSTSATSPASPGPTRRCWSRATARVLATDGRYTTQAAAQAPDLEVVVARECARGPGGARRQRAAGAARLRGARRHGGAARGAGRHRGRAGAGGPRSRGGAAAHGEGRRRARAAARGLRDQRPGAGGDLGSDRAGPDRARGGPRGWRPRCWSSARRRSRSTRSWRAAPTAPCPHHRPTDREIDRGDLLKIDFGARYGGYHADCTRTVVVGREPADWQREIYDVVRAAQRAGRHALAAGADVARCRRGGPAGGRGRRLRRGLPARPRATGSAWRSTRLR